MDVLDQLTARSTCGLCGRLVRFTDDFCSECRRTVPSLRPADTIPYSLTPAAFAALSGHPTARRRAPSRGPYLRRRDDGICAVGDCERKVLPTGARCSFHRTHGALAVPPSVRQLSPHGTIGSYKRGCRCAKCRAVNASAHRSWSERTRASR